MNFLELCQRTVTECGVATSSAVKTVLPTVANATGSLGRVVGWVDDAWSDIQMDHEDWDWMRSSVLLGGGVSFQTVAGQVSYPLGTGPGTLGVEADDFGKWDGGTFRNFPTDNGFLGEMFMDEIPFEYWRDGYMVGAMRTTQTRPVVIAIGPDQSLCFGPAPSAGYTVTADYYRAPQDLVDNADVPAGIPTRFHMLIVYRAMMKYAGYESAPEVFQRGSQEAAGMYAQLMSLRAPRIGWGGPLA